MKRKIMSVLLAAAMVTSMAGCSGSGDGAQTQAPADTPQQTQASNDAAPAETTAGDTSAEAPAETDAAPVTLKWAIWDKESTAYWQALADAYQKAAPNVTIEMVDLGSTDYMTVLATELSGEGSDFDVVTIKDVPGYATLVQKNAILS